MIKNREKKIALLHIAKKQTGITDDFYREILAKNAGIVSLKDMSEEWQFSVLISVFNKMGFKNKSQWACTPAQKWKINDLWQRCSRSKNYEGLNNFAKRMFHKNVFELDKREASDFITALIKISREIESEKAI